jgi:nucleoside-diphosphate-sugar epimerase
MKVLVTGATGFVGRHVVAELLLRGHDITAVARDADKAAAMPWAEAVDFVSFDIHSSDDIGRLGIPDVLVHLAWGGLPNYRSLFHFETNLPSHYRFLKTVVTAGTAHVLVTGTCLEYGLQNGPVAEDNPTSPTSAYGLAKDVLRRFLQELRTEVSFVLQWVRLFYLYGAGQNPNSLLAQLDRAITRGDSVFDMSAGEQLRDYLPIEEAARRIAILVEHPECSGVMNCCSGRPISVRSLVEQRLAERGASVALNLGRYAYPEFEPMAFWGAPGKLDRLVSQ